MYLHSLTQSLAHTHGHTLTHQKGPLPINTDIFHHNNRQKIYIGNIRNSRNKYMVGIHFNESQYDDKEEEKEDEDNDNELL